MKVNGKFVLTNGREIPAIGFGTWQMPNDQNTYEVLKKALNSGYSHIDTARDYGNEEMVGKAVRDSGRPREEIYVTTKLPASVKNPADVMASFELSLKKLGLDYVDLYLIHAPWPWTERGADYEKENVLIWKEMEKIYASGKAKAIGISNFSIANIENIMTQATITPHVNQIRYFIGETESELVKYCQDKGILIEAYSPLATGRLVNDERIALMAKKYNKSWAQICIRFCLINETLPLPKTNNFDRSMQNLDLDFDISDEDMEYLRSLDKGF